MRFWTLIPNFHFPRRLPIFKAGKRAKFVLKHPLDLTCIFGVLVSPWTVLMTEKRKSGVSLDNGVPWHCSAFTFSRRTFKFTSLTIFLNFFYTYANISKSILIIKTRTSRKKKGKKNFNEWQISKGKQEKTGRYTSTKKLKSTLSDRRDTWSWWEGWSGTGWSLAFVPSTFVPVILPNFTTLYTCRSTLLICPCALFQLSTRNLFFGLAAQAVFTFHLLSGNGRCLKWLSSLVLQHKSLGRRYFSELHIQLYNNSSWSED